MLVKIMYQASNNNEKKKKSMIRNQNNIPRKNSFVIVAVVFTDPFEYKNWTEIERFEIDKKERKKAKFGAHISIFHCSFNIEHCGLQCIRSQFYH